MEDAKSDLVNPTTETTNHHLNIPSEKGTSTDGQNYESIDDMWKKNHVDMEDSGVLKSDWYNNADKYWKEVHSTVDGMLGGYKQIAPEDIRGSKEFIKDFLSGKRGAKLPTTRALDVGAGIGRITKNFLVNYFDSVDLLERNHDFLEKAKTYINNGKVKNYFCYGMQEFSFENNNVRYDLIWIQWVIGHLIDSHLIEFLKKCQKALNPNGMIVIKDNNCPTGFIFDATDSSVTRSDSHLQALFKEAGLQLITVRQQSNFPSEIFPVRMYALR